MTGNYSYEKSIMTKRIRYSPETWPNPVYGPDDYFAAIVQYIGGMKATIIYPPFQQQSEMVWPE